MTDEQIEELVQQMPTDLELAGLGASEREEYLRARYNAIQRDMARARAEKLRSPHTFEPVLYESNWDTEFASESLVQAPRDAKEPADPLTEDDFFSTQGEDVEKEYESLPPQPYGPRLAPPPLPELTYWKNRKKLLSLELTAKVAHLYETGKAEKLKAEEERLAKEAPWLSHDPAERARAERMLQTDAHARQKIAISLDNARQLRLQRYELLKTKDKTYEATVRAQGGHERLAWQQITDQEWKEMSDVEFAFWRHNMASEWIQENEAQLSVDGHDLLHAGTFTIALRKALQEWQNALFAYEKALRPGHMSSDDLAVWNYEMTKTSWFKAGRALEKRLIEVERKSVLHRRATVLEYLAASFADWTAYYTTALENTRVLEQWGLDTIEEMMTKIEEKNSVPETERVESERGLNYGKQLREFEKLRIEWKNGCAGLLQALQNQKEIGPFPFDVPLEKIDQHVIDKLYAHIVLEEEKNNVALEETLVSPELLLPPAPMELKLSLSTSASALVSSGNSAESGLFGASLARAREEEVKTQYLRTLAEMERRTSLMHSYWKDHGISKIEVDEKSYDIPEDDKNMKELPFEVVERCYFELLDQGIDVHGLYEKPRWETDEAGRYRASSLSPFSVPPAEPIPLNTLKSAGPSFALDVLNNLIQLAFPNTTGSAAGDKLFGASEIFGKSGEISSEFNQTSKNSKTFAHSPSSWSHLSMMDAPKPRSLSSLRKTIKSGHPPVVKAERENAFYSAENEPVDPHPHLWRQLLTLTWRMRAPPRWLITRMPDTYKNWLGLNESDFEAEIAPSVDESSGLMMDPRKQALESPRRKAWELAKRTNDYKSLLLGATLTDTQSKALDKIAQTSLHMRSTILGLESESTASKDNNTTLNQKARFLQLKRDLISPEEVEAAHWASNFNVVAFWTHYLGEKTLPQDDGFAITARFSESYLSTVTDFVEPSPIAKKFDALLQARLMRDAEPKVLLELETDLFKRRQRIQKTFERGLPMSSTALMMYYYYAYALRARVDLFKKSVKRVRPNVAPELSVEIEIPAVAKSVAHRFRSMGLNIAYKFFGIDNKPKSRGLEFGMTVRETKELENAKNLVDLSRYLMKLDQTQPWNMWSQRPWTWQTSLKSAEARALDTQEYENAMSEPRAHFWSEQRQLWDDYLDATLGILHQLTIEQRLNQGIPTHKDIGNIDGTTAHEHYEKGESLLNAGEYSKALAELTQSARLGSAEALYTLGKLFSAKVFPRISAALPASERLEQPKLEEKSRSYLEQAASKGHVNALIMLANQCVDPPPGVRADMRRAVTALRTAIEEHGLVEANLTLALLYERGTTADRLKALELYRTIGSPKAKERAEALAEQLKAPTYKDASNIQEHLKENV